MWFEIRVNVESGVDECYVLLLKENFYYLLLGIVISNFI